MTETTEPLGDQEAEPVYVTVGILYGPIPTAETDGQDAPMPKRGGMLRYGHEIVEIDLHSLLLLNRTRAPQPLSALLTYARSQQFDDPESHITALVDRGFLVRIGHNEEADMGLLRSLRLHQMGIGVGCVGDNDQAYTISDHQGTLLQTVDFLTYTIWALSDGRSIGEIAGQVAPIAGRTPDDIVRHVRHTLKALTIAGIWALDTTES